MRAGASGRPGDQNRSAWRTGPVLAGLGAFSVAAQTILFRFFLASFEGNELGIGAFFGSWLLWVAAGAWLARHLLRRYAGGDAPFLPAVLLYPAALAVQLALTTNARALAGVASYDLFPLFRMMGMAVLVNGPVSFLTGWLFAAACRWAGNTSALPVARVYILEALGACFGGVLITVCLACGVRGETAAVAVSALLAGTVVLAAWDRNRGRAVAVPAAVSLVLLGALAGGAGGGWGRMNDRAAWGGCCRRKPMGGGSARLKPPISMGSETNNSS